MITTSVNGVAAQQDGTLKSSELVDAMLARINGNPNAKLTTPGSIAVRTDSNEQRDLSVMFLNNEEGAGVTARLTVNFPLDTQIATPENISQVVFAVPYPDGVPQDYPSKNISHRALNFKDLSANLQEQILTGINNLLKNPRAVELKNDALARSLARPTTSAA